MFQCEPLGDAALLVRFDDSIDPAVNDQVHAAAGALRAIELAGIDNLVSAYASLAVQYDPIVWTQSGNLGSAYANLVAAVTACLAKADGLVPVNLPEVHIPVCYGGAFGADLDAVATCTHLTPSEVIALHTAPAYLVAMLGFSPGFPYLIGLDPALHAPRKASPRTRVPAGSVAIGGAQTGIYPRELPGGWQLIGRTPMVLFDASAVPPATLGAGYRVRFHAIDADEFKRLGN